MKLIIMSGTYDFLQLWLLLASIALVYTKIPAYLPKTRTYLNLRAKHVGNLKSRAFCHIPHLTSIRIVSDRLNNIDPDAFKCMGHLTNLKLRSCQIRSLPASVFISLHTLHSLDLSGKRAQVDV